MVDWRSPEAEAVCVFLFYKMAIFLTGGFVWHLIDSWSIVEGALLTRRAKLSCAHIPYLLGRYGQLASLILITRIGFMSTTASMSCKERHYLRAAYVIGGIAFAAASANLGLRAYTLWKRVKLAKYTIIGFTVVHLGYAILGGATLYQPRWNASHTICNIQNVTDTMRRVLMGFYLFTTLWDWTILVLTVVGLHRQNIPSNAPVRTYLMKQGICYVLIACLTCIPMTVLVSLDLDDMLNISLSIPASMICVMASSVAVTHLSKMKDTGSSYYRASLALGGLTQLSNAQLTTNINL